MPARNYKQWNRVPGKINSGEYVDSRIYSEKKIFDEEIEKIFSKVWIPVCHESELPKTNSFRTMTVAMQSIIVVRISDKEIKAYHNQSINKPVGTLSTLTFPDEHEIRTEVKYGGFIWVTLNEDMDKTVEEWAAGAFDCMQKSLDAEPLEVFHYHKAIIPCNY